MRIGGVLSRITHSVNGRRILEGIIAGEACEDILGGLSWHVRKKLGLLGDALSFELDMQARWILSDLLARFDSDTARIEAANRRMEAALAPYEAQVRLLETLPGVSRESAMAILVELGPDMAVFASARHCAAWSGDLSGEQRECRQAPQRTDTAGKPDPARHSRRMRSCGGPDPGLPVSRPWHQAVKSRRGYKRAIVAVAHKMLRTIYAMLRDGTPYADPGIDYEGISIGRKASRWLQKLEQYGYVHATGTRGTTRHVGPTRLSPGVARNRSRPVTRPFSGEPE